MTFHRRPRSASEWLIALRESPGDESLRAAFDEWLADDPANAREWARARRAYELLGSVRFSAGADGAGETTSPAAFRRSRWIATAAAVAASIVVAWVVAIAVPALMLRLNADYVTATGEVRRLALADGSTVRLGPRSALAVSMTETDRRVEVITGRAFFEVRHDPGRPFRVAGGIANATALGTAFEIRSEAQATTVAVRDGQVRIQSGSDGVPFSETLSVGGVVRLTRDGGITRGRMPPELVAAWRDHRLVAKDLPVDRAVDELRQYFRGLVWLRGDELARQPVTGIYDLSDPAAALHAIAAAQNAEVYRISPWVLIISGS